MSPSPAWRNLWMAWPLSSLKFASQCQPHTPLFSNCLWNNFAVCDKFFWLIPPYAPLTFLLVVIQLFMRPQARQIFLNCSGPIQCFKCKVYNRIKLEIQKNVSYNYSFCYFFWFKIKKQSCTHVSISLYVH